LQAVIIHTQKVKIPKQLEIILMQRVLEHMRGRKVLTLRATTHRHMAKVLTLRDIIQEPINIPMQKATAQRLMEKHMQKDLRLSRVAGIHTQKDIKPKLTQKQRRRMREEKVLKHLQKEVLHMVAMLMQK
jgi:hypothetical protein